MRTEVTAEMLERLLEQSQAYAPGDDTGASRILQERLPTHLGGYGPQGHRRPVPETAQEIAKLKSALAVLSPNAPRGQGKLYEPGDLGTSSDYWLAVVWAMASLGWQCGKEIARDWSQGSERYTDEGFEAAWNKYDPNHPNPIGIATLYRLANSHGWDGQAPTDNSEPIAVDASRYKVMSSAEIRGLPEQAWRVKGVLPASGLGALYGPPGSGKSFLAVDLSVAIASGRLWFGHRTYQTRVIYVMLEGQGGIKNRIAALEQARGTQLPGQFGVITQPFQLTSSQDVADLAAVIPDGAMVIIDTLNRAAPTSDENSSKDMGTILQAAKELQERTGGLILLVHHTGKDVSKGMRGHSSLHAALDVAIQVERSESGTRYWSIAKAKDGEDGKQFAFKLKHHVLWQDADGDDVTSCSVEPDASAVFTKPEPKGKNQKAALGAIRAALNLGTAMSGGAGCPPGTKAMKLEDAINAVISTLPQVQKNKQRNTANSLVAALRNSGYLCSMDDGAGEAWCWLV